MPDYQSSSDPIIPDIPIISSVNEIELDQLGSDENGLILMETI